MTAEENALVSLVARLVDLRAATIKISPSWIATEAMNELDPGRHSIALVYSGCHMHLRQLAREQLRKKFEDRDTQEEGNKQYEMFSDLQDRYPSARSQSEPEPTYVLRDYMTDLDVEYNATRLEREGVAKIKHARTLRAWNRARRAA